MRKILAVVFCLCVFFSSFCLAKSGEQREANTQSSLAVSKTITNSEFPNIFRPIGNWFKRIFGVKQKNAHCPPNAPPIIESVILSASEITKECSSYKPIQNNSCSNTIKTIDVTTVAKDDENDVLVYYYEVSGGKIIGRGSKVIWDLSDVKPGTYTIIIGVDDGAGFEGRTVTKEIKVVECPNCN
jgi:hypothetical protein